jgi:hypothetical protein
MLVMALSGADPVKRMSLINAKDKSGQTPLYYACRSGRPETVALLLDAGADPRITANRGMTVFGACLEFEEEQELWRGYGKITEASEADRRTIWESGRGHLLRSYVCAAGTKLEDTSRPFVNSSGKEIKGFLGRVSTAEINTCQDTARLQEILDLLLTHTTRLGNNSTWMREAISSSFYRGVYQHGHDYTSRCFEQLRERAEPEAVESMSQSRGFNALILKYQREVISRVVDDADDIRLGKSNTCVLYQLLREREYGLVERLFHRGTSFLAIRKCEKEETNLHYLANHGFSGLLEKLGSLEADARFKEGAWHAAGDPKRPGLGYCRTGPGFVYPLLFTACQRELPNMDVVRVLVETLNVDVNARRNAKPGENSYADSIPGGMTALHCLAFGNHWWQAAQGIPFLVTQAGANMELRNDHGETPLQVALHSEGVFQKQAAQALVELGAGINSVDGKGLSCLAVAALELPTLELEDRDTQGRTLLLSACRSALGANAAIDSTLGDIRWNTSTGGCERDPSPIHTPPPPSSISSAAVPIPMLAIPEAKMLCISS